MLNVSLIDKFGPRQLYCAVAHWKFIEPRSYADSEAAAKKLLEIANEVEAVQDGRIHIEKINGPFIYQLRGSPAEYKAGLDLAIARGLAVAARERHLCEVHAGRAELFGA
jgi:hypothetical protein